MFRVTTCDRLPTGSPIVKGDQYAAAREGDRIVAQAEAEAKAIRDQAKQEYQRQLRQGYDEGRRQAAADAAEQMTVHVAEAAAFFSTVEDRVVQVVCKALRKIVGEMDQRELIVAVVRQALGWARNQSRVTLRVSAAHVNALDARLEEIRRNYPAIDVLDIKVDDRLEALDCILETEIGAVNASVEVQLAAIEAALRQAVLGQRSASQCNSLPQPDAAPTGIDLAGAPPANQACESE